MIIINYNDNKPVSITIKDTPWNVSTIQIDISNKITTPVRYKIQVWFKVRIQVTVAVINNLYYDINQTQLF